MLPWEANYTGVYFGLTRQLAARLRIRVPCTAQFTALAALTVSFFPSPFTTPTMSTEVPYAADAEVALSYDELEVSTHLPHVSITP